MESLHEKSLPKIVILATGGTIAGEASCADQTSDYSIGKLGVNSLIRAVPQLSEIANVSGEQIINTGSQNMTDAIWLRIAARVNELLDSGQADGIVITHGTDTLEETAFFLELTVRSNRPVVLTGAMRPATALSADGPINLLNAVRTASSNDACSHGVLVAMNDEIYAARDVCKMNTQNLATFRAPNAGPVGIISSGQPHFFHQSLKPRIFFSVNKLQELPRADVVFLCAGSDALLIDAAVKSGTKAIVLAASGNGAVPTAILGRLREITIQGIIVIRASHVPSGYVTASKTRYAEAGLLYSNSLSPQKARILVKLALTRHEKPQEIQNILNLF